jgi:dienelactone hydrolase
LIRIAALGFVLMATAANAKLPKVDAALFATTPIALSDSISGVIVTVPSRNPLDYGPAMRGELGTSVTLTAQLFLPVAPVAHHPAVIPAVIIVPGSGGIGPHHIEQASVLVAAGFAVLIIDPFHARGIGDTIADQAQVTWAASAYDVLAALAYLRTRPDIDQKRIGAVGSSRGGTAAMMAAAAPFSDAIAGRGRGLRAVVAGYPWCGTQFRSARIAKGAALLLLQGDRDDWVSVQQCQDAVHAISVAGGDATMKIFAGGLHALDRSGVAPTRIESAITSTIYPTVYMDDAGQYFDLRSGAVDPALRPSDFVTQSVSGSFLHKGVTVGSSGTQAADYVREMVEFIKLRLK